MTLLGNRARTTASDNEVANKDGFQDGQKDNRTTTGRKISLSPKTASAKAGPAAAPPEEALRTLRMRLQAQLDAGEDNATDPEARFLVHSVRRRLNQVNAALEQIDEGRYGVCTDCDKPIEQDRLVLQPMSTRCTRCQSVAEWRGSAY